MSDNSATRVTQLLSAEQRQEIDTWIAKYPRDQKQSAVMTALFIVQKDHGYLTVELMDAVAHYLEMPPIAVYEVASFYTMYEQKPVGRHLVNVCTSISCKLRDSAAVVDHLEEKLGIKLGETTQDGCFTIRSVECLGACVHAPMMQVDNDYHEKLTTDKIDTVLEKYR